jgi:superfamily II DNA or RNA helicase
MSRFSIFETKSTIRSPKIDNIFYQLKERDGSFYLAVTDSKGKEVSTSYKYYESPHREILLTINNILETQLNTLNVNNILSGSVRVQDHPYLLDQLVKSNTLVDQKMNKITVEDSNSEVSIHISKSKNEYIPEIFLNGEKYDCKEMSFLTSSHLFHKDSNVICKCSDISGNIDHLKPFLHSFPESFLQMYLSLILSHLGKINIVLDDYRFINCGAKHSKPALFFDKVDSDLSLYMRLSSIIEGFDNSFLDNLDLLKACNINHKSKTIQIYDIVYDDIGSHITKISKKLNSLVKKNKLDVSFMVDDGNIVVPKDLTEKFLEQSIYELVEEYKIFGFDNLSSFKIKRVKPKVSFSFSGSGIDFLEGTASVNLNGEEISIAQLIDQYKNNKYISLSDQSKGIIDKSYMQKLCRIFKGDSDKFKWSFFDLPVVNDIIEEKITNDAFNKSREIFDGFNKIEEISLDKVKVKAQLRDYQKEGIKWMSYLHNNNLGGCLADDMGLGKTVQAIGLLSTIYPKEKKPTLILLPKTLLFNWENELKKFFPKCSYYSFYGKNDDIKEASKHSIILSTYGKCRNKINDLKKIDFYYVILDESQIIKNVNSNISKAVMLLQSRHRLALSGTPIENNLLELYALFRFLNPSMFGSIKEFQSLYQNPIQKEQDELSSAELRLKIYPFILRRLKQDVLKQLPDKIEKTMIVEMSKEQKEFYEQRRDYYQKLIGDTISDVGIEKSQMTIFQALTELRQIASVPESKNSQISSTPKREMVIEEARDAISNGHKILIFANFLSAIESISEDLSNSGIEHIVMTGKTSNREVLVNSFQNDPSVKVFLATIKTGSVGLNLTAADTVFIYDPWWNKSIENQAMDRSHRIGQQKKVMCYKFITKDTIEEKILELQKVKSNMINQLIKSDQSSFKSLTTDDINTLLSK